MFEKIYESRLGAKGRQKWKQTVRLPSNVSQQPDTVTRYA